MSLITLIGFGADTSYTVGNITTAMNKTDWTVYGSSDVDKIYASDGHYSCQWQHRSPQGTQTSFPGQVSLTQFSDSTGQQYRRMTCSFTGQPLPTEVGQHTYLLTIDPRNSTTEAHSSVIYIQSPQGPPVLHNCPRAIVEGDDVSCTCQASASEPSALVSWNSSPLSNTSTLQLNNVSQSLEGQCFTCRQYWGGFDTGHVKETNYTVNMKQGVDATTMPPDGHTNKMLDNGEDDDDDSSVVYIVGGVVGATVLIIIIAIVIVFLIRRHRGKAARGEARSTNTEGDEEIIEHINAIYQSSDDPDSNQVNPSMVVEKHDEPSDRGDPGHDPAQNVYAQVNKKSKGGNLVVPLTPEEETGNDDEPKPRVTAQLSVSMKPQHAGKAERGEARSTDTEMAEEIVEHINAIYQSSDDPDSDQANPSMVVEQHGEHGDRGDPAQNVYAQVNKKSKGENPVIPQTPEEETDNNDEPMPLVTAQPSEPVKPQHADFVKPINTSIADDSGSDQIQPFAGAHWILGVEHHAEPGDRVDPDNDPAQNVYTQVNKKSKGGNPGVPPPPEEEAENYEYAQVRKAHRPDKPLPAAKPKPPVTAKPSVSVKPRIADVGSGKENPSQETALVTRGFGDVVLPNDQISITAEDDYNTLAFHRSPSTELSENPESDYNHIGAVGQTI